MLFKFMMAFLRTSRFWSHDIFNKDRARTDVESIEISNSTAEQLAAKGARRLHLSHGPGASTRPYNGLPLNLNSNC